MKKFLVAGLFFLAGCQTPYVARPYKYYSPMYMNLQCESVKKVNFVITELNGCITNNPLFTDKVFNIYNPTNFVEIL